MSPARIDLLTGGMLLLILALPPSRALLEGHMAGHMLVQIPLLVAAGAWLGGALPRTWRRALAAWNAHGLPGLLLALFTLGVWLLPRSLDAALQEPLVAASKFLTLPLLAGLPLRLSWPSLPTVARGVVWSNLLAMLGVMSWLYLEAPLRVCNNYLQNDQVVVGKLLLGILAAVGITLVVRLFMGTGAAPERAADGLGSGTPGTARS